MFSAMKSIILLICLYKCIDGYTTKWGVKKFTEYQEGDTNIVLTSSHGGILKPDELPTRKKAGCYNKSTKTCVFDYTCTERDEVNCRAVTVKDTNSRELAVELADELEKLMNKRPHVIATHLHRTKLDPNREVNQATFGDKLATEAYNDFHGFVEEALGKIKTPGILFDIHGQSHPEKWVELGYTNSIVQLNTRNYNCSDVSVKNLVLLNCEDCGGDCLFDIIHGNNSFGTYLSNEGQFKVVPSLYYPSPGNGSYFNGGYITRRYGSRVEGQIDAIQIESPFKLRSDAERGNYAKGLANAIKLYMDKYYKGHLSGDSSINKGCSMIYYFIIYFTCHLFVGRD